MKTFIFCLVLLLKNCSSSTNDSINNINEKHNFSINEIRIIYKLNKFENFYLKVELDTIDPMVINNVLEKDTLLMSKIEMDLEKLDYKETKNKITNWECIEFVIFLASKDSTQDLNEFFYEDYRTNFLYSKYINHPSQDWGSLSSKQYYQVFDDIIFYIYKLEKVDRLNIISDFFQFMKK